VQRLLPGNKKARRGWDVEIPDHLSCEIGDHVVYRAVNRLGGEHTFSDKETAPVSTRVCYAECRPKYNNYDIECMPHNMKKRGVITIDDVITFFNYFDALEMLPEGIEMWEKAPGSGTHILIKADSKTNPHYYYVALTLYRWVDSHPVLVWKFLRLMESNPELHPMQVLPHLIEKYINNSNHSFIEVGLAYTAAINPLSGLSAKLYFDSSSKFGKKALAEPTKYVLDGIKEICEKITPMIKLKVPVSKHPWSPTYTTEPLYVLEQGVDCLSPVLTELYNLTNPNKKTIVEFLEENFTKERR